MATDACMAHPEAGTYLQQVQARAYSLWEPGAGTYGDGIKILFRLDEQGNLLSSQVRSAQDNAEAQRVLDALAAGSPYPPMPEPAKCLAGMNLVATFRTPPVGVPVAGIVGAVPVFTALLLLSVFWFMNRRREDTDSASADAEVLPLGPSDEHRYFRSRIQRVAEVLLPLHAVIVVSHSPWVFAALALVDVAVFVDVWRKWNTPVLRISPAEIEVNNLLTPARKILTHEVASWAATRALLVLRSARGEELNIPLAHLSEGDRKHVLALVRGLPLASSPAPPLTAAELGRRQWRRFALIIGTATIGSALMIWYGLRSLG